MLLSVQMLQQGCAMLPTAMPTKQAAAGTSFFHPKRERVLQDQGDHKKLGGCGRDAAPGLLQEPSLEMPSQLLPAPKSCQALACVHSFMESAMPATFSMISPWPVL